MVYALLASLPWAGVLCYVLHAHNQHDRTLREAQTAEREEWRQLEQSLLNRIQAPAQEVAVQVAEQHRSPDPLHVAFDDDEDFARALEERR